MSHQSDEAGVGHSDTLTASVIEAVAEARDVEETAFQPLYEVVDPDALEGLFEPCQDGTSRASGRVVFQLAGCEVVVHGDEEVEVTRVDEVETTENAESTIGSMEQERDRVSSIPERRG